MAGMPGLKIEMKARSELKTDLRIRGWDITGEQPRYSWDQDWVVNDQKVKKKRLQVSLNDGEILISGKYHSRRNR